VKLRSLAPCVSSDGDSYIRDDPLVIPNIIHAQGGQNSVITDGQFSVVIPKNIGLNKNDSPLSTKLPVKETALKLTFKNTYL
jgi:hypothetical protein